MQYEIRLPIVEVSPELSPTLRSCDIRDEGDDMRKRFNGVQIDADNEAALGHIFFGNLKPTARSSAEIYHTSAFRKQIVFAVEMDEFATDRSTVNQPSFDLGDIPCPAELTESTHKAERAR